MNGFIIYPLIIMMVIGAFNYSYLYGTVDFTSSNDQSQDFTINQTIDGSESEIEMDEANLNFDFNMTTGLVALIVVVIAISFLGASVLGSKIFSESGLKMFYNAVVWYGLWAIFSAFSITAIASIPSFGILLWFIFTFIFSLGVFGKMGD